MNTFVLIITFVMEACAIVTGANFVYELIRAIKASKKQNKGNK